MQTLETLAASVADQLEPRRMASGTPEVPSADEPSADARATAALIRWVATHGLDGSVFVAGWELGTQGQRGTDGFGGLLARASAAEDAAWKAFASHGRAVSADDLVTFVGRLRVAARMLTRSAVKGFIAGRDQSHRRWLRELRHDLRNPIGAIKNAVALLEETRDESGTVQRLCTIAGRNASALESLVRSRAADDADPGAADWAGRASAAAVIDRVVGELAALVPALGTRLVVRRAPARPVDALALEIALHAIVRHMVASEQPIELSGSRPGESRAGEMVTLRIGPAPAPGDVAPPAEQSTVAASGALVALARSAVEASGGALVPKPAEGAYTLELPVLASGEEGHDLAGEGKRADRQPRPL